jgi:hypothetical protein
MSDQVIMSNALTLEECVYLLSVVRAHLSYYEMLMGLPEVSEANTARYHLVKGIIGKLR